MLKQHNRAPSDFEWGNTLEGHGSRLMDQEIRFSGIVVTYNDAKHLYRCLKSLSFCEQLLVIDLGSTDDSVRIAHACGSEVMPHHWVPIVEEVRKEATAYARNDWIIFLDPDEVFPVQAVPKIVAVIQNEPRLGAINAPWQFYFKGKPLDCTIWGWGTFKGIVHNKHRNRFFPLVHKGTQLLDGYTSYTLPKGPEHSLMHYWADSYTQLFRKHWRYAKEEGLARYRSGERFSWTRSLLHVASALKTNLFDFRGLQGGIHGILLSLFYSCYIGISLLSLRRYQNHFNPR